MKKTAQIAITLFFLSFALGNAPVQQWVRAWNKTTTLTLPRAGAAVVEANGYIFIIGGVNKDGFLKKTEYARIGNDGSLGPWKEGPPLNQERGHTDAVFYDGSIYVVGGAHGKNGKELLRSVERMTIQSDGSLSAWQKVGQGMNMPRRCSKVILVDDVVYSFGGYGGDMLKTVEHAKINKENQLGDWFEEGENMTTLRYISGVKKSGDSVYVVGGHDQKRGTGIADTEWSTVIDEAGFQQWKKTALLQVGRYGLSLAIHNNNLYAMGGNTGYQFLESVEKAKIGAKGELMSWQYTTPLSTSRAAFASIIYKDWIYIFGGAVGNVYLDSVEYATFDKDGNIGFRASHDEAGNFEDKIKKEEERVESLLPGEGIVLNVLQSPVFSYLQIRGKEGVLWLSAPVTNVKIGDAISYGRGLNMGNFWSRELGRTFPSIVILPTAVKELDK